MAYLQQWAVQAGAKKVFIAVLADKNKSSCKRRLFRTCVSGQIFVWLWYGYSRLRAQPFDFICRAELAKQEAELRGFVPAVCDTVQALSRLAQGIRGLQSG